MLQTSDTSEKGLEAIIETHLAEVAGYRRAYSNEYDRDLCINRRHLFEFLKETQPEKYEIILKRGEETFLKRLAEQIRKRGVIDVLRKGIKDLALS